MTGNLQLKDDLPQWLREWLVQQGYAEEVSDGETRSDLRARIPNEADYVQGKRPGPRTETPE